MIQVERRFRSWRASICRQWGIRPADARWLRPVTHQLPLVQWVTKWHLVGGVRRPGPPRDADAAKRALHRYVDALYSTYKETRCRRNSHT